MEGVWLEISCQELWPNFLLARAKAQPIDYYYYPPAWIYSFAIIGSEKDNEWPGILNVVDTDIVGVLKSWALVGMSWPKVASPCWIIHSRSDSATIGRRNGNLFFSSRYRLSIGFLLCSVSFQDWCVVCLLWVILECGLGFISGSYQCSYDLLNLLFPAQTRVLFVDIRTLFTRALIHGRSLLQWWNPLLYLFIYYIG